MQTIIGQIFGQYRDKIVLEGFQSCIYETTTINFKKIEIEVEPALS